MRASAPPPTVTVMAWRIDESVIRGEIDNRVRGRVTGRIWFLGLAEPVELDLGGNAWRDLAGRKLEFTNPEPKPLEIDFRNFAPRQVGVIGDCTASRKVKVPEVSMDELMKLFEQRKPFPWHWGNSLYLEWFSESNGRVMIESASYTLVVSSDVTWDMTPDEEREQRIANGRAMTGFFERLGAAIAPDESTVAPAEGGGGDSAKDDENDGEPWSDEGDDGPLTEAGAEKMQEESDRLVDRIQARMEREGPGADFGKILNEELERRRLERGEDPPTPEEEAERAEWQEAANRAAEEAIENPDPDLEDELDEKHPLAERAYTLALRLMQEPEKRGWIPSDAREEHPLIELGAAAAKSGAKLAGALNGEEWPVPRDDCAHIIVRLKRARGYLDDALRAADDCIEQSLGDSAWLAAVRLELTEIATGCDQLLVELRARLEGPCD